jgi:hypothetical protein
MARRIALAVAWAVGGYIIGAVGGGLLVGMLSSNQFDRQMEQVMTGAFVTGPLAAVIAFVTGFVRAGRRPPPAL